MSNTFMNATMSNTFMNVNMSNTFMNATDYNAFMNTTESGIGMTVTIPLELTTMISAFTISNSSVPTTSDPDAEDNGPVFASKFMNLVVVPLIIGVGLCGNLLSGLVFIRSALRNISSSMVCLYCFILYLKQ